MKTARDMSELPSVLTVDQVSEVLGINRGAAYELAHRDTFPKIQIGRRIVIPKDAFAEWMHNEATRG